MSIENPKLPKTGGAKRVMEALKKNRNQQPSDRLVKIIAEYGRELEEEKEKVLKKPTAAAKDQGL